MVDVAYRGSSRSGLGMLIDFGGGRSGNPSAPLDQRDVQVESTVELT